MFCWALITFVPFSAFAALHDEIGVARPDRSDAVAQRQPSGSFVVHRVSLGDCGHRSTSSGRAVERRPRRVQSICRAMKAKAFAKMRVPSTLTSGGTPKRDAP